MEKRRRKRKIKIGRVLAFVIILILIIGIIIFFTSKGKNISIGKSSMYLAGDTNKVTTYIMDEDNSLKENSELVRGKKVIYSGKKINMNDNEYLLIEFDNKEYYVNAKQLVKNVKDVVLEKERYVRTSVTVYENETDSKIASFIKKGNKLDIIGYDKLFDDGNVNMYKIKYNDTEGYVYSKYLVNDKESADSVYNENGVYDIHKDRKFKGRELYGGKASTLDYYPYERVEFEDNKLLKKAKTMYLNAGTIGSIDSYLKIAKENGVNV